MSGQCSLTPSLRLLGRGFLTWMRLSTLTAATTTAARGDAAKRALENAAETGAGLTRNAACLGILSILVLRDYGAARATFDRVSKMLPGSSEVRGPLAKLPNARDIGTKALFTSSKPSPWTHAMWRHSSRQHGPTLAFDSSQLR